MDKLMYILAQTEYTVEAINGVLWGYILVFALVGLGVYLTIKLKFPQRMIGPALKKMVGDVIENKVVEEGKMSPFQSLATAVAAQVGTGNIVGVATAIASGGPGAAFWMILSAFFGMASIFSEAVLAQKYRECSDGELVGGPAYYIKNGLKSPILSKIFALVCILALGIVGIMVQSNSVVISINDSFQIPKVAITLALLVVVAVILTGGMGRIASFSESIVPIMAFAYIFGSLVVVIVNRANFIPALKAIFVGAFTPQAIMGGALGIGIQSAIRFGLSRGLFSNEAGMGSTPHSHAVASTKHPVEQGSVAMVGVFIATFVICLSTVMTNLTGGVYNMSVPASEMELVAPLLTQNSFELVFPGVGAKFVSVSLTLFSLTTIVGWYFFAESNIKFLAGDKKIIINGFKFVVLLFMVLGSQIDDADFLWEIADMFMGLMALPNIIALFLLSKDSVSILSDYKTQVRSGKALKWNYEYE